MHFSVTWVSQTLLGILCYKFRVVHREETLSGSRDVLTKAGILAILTEVDDDDEHDDDDDDGTDRSDFNLSTLAANVFNSYNDNNNNNIIIIIIIISSSNNSSRSTG